MSEEPTGVVSFRLKPKEQRQLTKALSENPVIGVRSKNQYARKLVQDFLNGSLVYLNPNSVTKNSALG